MFEFLISSEFLKSLKKIDFADQKSIKDKLKTISTSENPFLFCKKLKNHKNIFRFRSGDYRIIFRTEKNKIILLLVKHRKNIYKEKFD